MKSLAKGRDYADISPVAGVIRGSREQDFFLEVLDWLTKYADHEPDWADACLAILSERDKNLKVWTYDREFRTTWRRSNGTVIPLAVRSI